MQQPLPGAFPDQKIAVLVDTANMYHSARSQYGGRLDYRRLLRFVVRDRRLIRALAFVARGDDQDVTPFLDALAGVGFETRVKVLRRRADGSTRGDFDVGMTLAAVEFAARVDVVALITGDGDFAELVDYLDSRGVRVEVYAFDSCASGELIERAHSYRAIDKELLIGPSPKAAGGNG